MYIFSLKLSSTSYFIDGTLTDKVKYQIRLLEQARPRALQYVESQERRRDALDKMSITGIDDIFRLHGDEDEESSSEDEDIKAKRRRLAMIRGETIRDDEDSDDDVELHRPPLRQEQIEEDDSVYYEDDVAPKAAMEAPVDMIRMNTIRHVSSFSLPSHVST